MPRLITNIKLIKIKKIKKNKKQNSLSSFIKIVEYEVFNNILLLNLCNIF